MALSGLTQNKPYDPQHVYPQTALQADFRLLQRQLERTHPALYRYTPRAEFSRFCDSLRGAISGPMTEQGFLGLISLLNGKIMDGHTMHLPSEQAMEYYGAQGLLFPFAITWINGRMYITENNSQDSSIAAGAAIIAINGRPAAEVMQSLLARQIRDGFNPMYALWILQRYFASYYRITFGDTAQFSLQLRTQEETRHYQVAALPKPAIRQNQQLRYSRQYPASNAGRGITLSLFPDIHGAALCIKSFATDLLESVYEQSFKTTLDSLFLQLEQHHTQRLVLDLRDNQGGDFEPGRQLLSYLLLQPAAYLPGSKESSVIQPAPHHFSGQLLVLVNGGSFSNTSIVSAILSQQHRAVFIGTETGGNAVILSGNAKEVILPHTHIRSYISTTNYQISTAVNTGHGVQPSYTVTPGIADILADRDVVMERAMELLKQ